MWFIDWWSAVLLTEGELCSRNLDAPTASGLFSPATNGSDGFLALQKPSTCKALEKSRFIFKGVGGGPYCFENETL